MSLMDAITGNSSEDNHAVVPVTSSRKKSEKVIIITANNTEDIEFFYPYYRLSEEGYTVDVVTPDGGKFEAKHGLGLKETKSISDVKPQDYALLYIPGGKAPAELRKNDKVLAFVKEFARAGKPIAAICHGPQVLIEAGRAVSRRVPDGRRARPEVGDEIKKAGGTFVDETCVVDGQFITARRPGDLPNHLLRVLEQLRGDMERRSTAA